jgi:preprotein translocase subunit SecF
VFVFPKVEKGIDLTGGTLIIVRLEKALEPKEVEKILNQKFQLTNLSVASVQGANTFGLNIQFAENKELSSAEQELLKAQELINSNPEESKQHSLKVLSILSNYAENTNSSNPKELLSIAQETFAKAREGFFNELKSVLVSSFSLKEEPLIQSKEISPTLGKMFFDSAIFVTIVAIVSVILVIFVFFKEFIPSMAVIGAAFFDILGALALMAVFKVPLSLSSIPALLMLVGYSVDTDIMLTSRLLKRKEKTPRERTIDSMKTGLTMTLTTIAAAASMVLIAFLNQMTVIFEIGAVLLFGLTADIISTWAMNAPILLLYVKKKKRGALF